MSLLSGKYEIDTAAMESLIRSDKSFDILVKRIKLSDKRATLYSIDGFVKEEIMEKIMEFFVKIPADDMRKIKNTQQLLDNMITYIECSAEKDTDILVSLILSGAVIMLVEGFDEAVIIDARSYPARNIEEPENDKVLRGSHEGFVETLVFNTALIRRKIRDTNLTMELVQVGNSSKTDIVICYIDGKHDKKKLEVIRKRLKSIDVEALSMGQESLKECLVPSQKWNPYPKIRYTERPDTAAACLYEGNILVMSDGSPSVMIFPTGIFDFVQDINDYYFSPCVGSFLRFIRCGVFVLSMILMPLWYLLMKNPEWIPSWLEAIKIKEEITVPIIVQILIIEFVIDALKLASLNTPSALSNSFSVVGALVLGEFAVNSGLFAAEVVLFMSFVAIANFTQPSYELGYAIKLSRITIIILTAAFDIWGFIAALLITALVICFTKTIDGYTYLYPLIPFNKDALISLIVRKSIKVKYKNNK